MRPEEVQSFIDSATGDDIRNTLASLAADPQPESIDVLKAFLLYRESHTLYKHAVPRLVCLALLQKGAAGVAALRDILPDVPGSIYPTAIIEALWYASKDQTLVSPLGNLLQPIAPLTNRL